MMDIEQTKKLNFMIKELTRTGAAASFDDAVSMAGNVYDGGLPKTTSSVIAQDGDRMREMVDLRIRHHLGVQADQYNETLKRMAEQNDNLSSEIKKLWGVIESLKQSPRNTKPEEIESTREAQIVSRPAESQMQPRGFQVEEKRQEPIAHPRSGNYNSTDVALDKFFYFGNRK